MSVLLTYTRRGTPAIATSEDHPIRIVVPVVASRISTFNLASIAESLGILDSDMRKRVVDNTKNTRVINNRLCKGVVNHLEAVHKRIIVVKPEEDLPLPLGFRRPPSQYPPARAEDLPLPPSHALQYPPTDTPPTQNPVQDASPHETPAVELPQEDAASSLLTDITRLLDDADASVIVPYRTEEHEYQALYAEARTMGLTSVNYNELIPGVMELSVLKWLLNEYRISTEVGRDFLRVVFVQGLRDFTPKRIIRSKTLPADIKFLMEERRTLTNAVDRDINLQTQYEMILRSSPEQLYNVAYSVGLLAVPYEKSMRSFMTRKVIMDSLKEYLAAEEGIREPIRLHMQEYVDNFWPK